MVSLNPFTPAHPRLCFLRSYELDAALLYNQKEPGARRNDNNPVRLSSSFVIHTSDRAPQSCSQLRARLAEAEHVRRSIQIGVDEYLKHLNRYRSALRQLRAWRIMLMLSKTYMLLAKQGWRGRWEWLKWIALTPIRGPGDLRPFEPVPPDLATLLPLNYSRPFASAEDPVASDGFTPSSTYDVLMLGAEANEKWIGEPNLPGHRFFLVSSSEREIGGPYQYRKLAKDRWLIELPHCTRPAGGTGHLTDAERLNVLFLDAQINSAVAVLCAPEWSGTVEGLRTTWGAGPVLGPADWQVPARRDEKIRQGFEPISIIIVTHNSERYIIPCLESILRHATYPAIEVICVDNASHDGTVRQLSDFEASDHRIRVLRFRENRGFAAANNAGVSLSTGSVLILLNADTVVTSGWIERILAHLSKDSRIGILNPVTNCAGNEVMIACDYGTPAQMDLFAAQLARAKRGCTSHVSMSPLFCAAIPRRVWDQVGGLDEEYGIGMFEDDDYSLRVRKLGYRLAVAEDCFVHHAGQGSFGQLSAAAFNQILERNRNRFEEKWGTKWIEHRKRPGVLAAGGRLAPESFRRVNADGMTAGGER